MAGFNDGDFLERGHIWRRDFIPLLTAVTSEMDASVVRAGPNAVDIERRRRYRINYAALHGLGRFFVAIFADAHRNFKRRASEARRNRLPALAAVHRLPQSIGGEIKDVRVARGEHDRLSAQHAIIRRAE